MIDRKTVFILGAGSSLPYGYFTGNDLRKKLCLEYDTIIRNPSIEVNTLNFPQNDYHAIIQEAKEFSNAFLKSSTSSIDLFLSRNRKFEEIGKLGIALFILKSENPDCFNEKTVDKYREQDWYFYLYNRLSEDLLTKDSYHDFKKNKVSFITFNYDRSLEYYLYTSLVNSFKEVMLDTSIKTEKIHFKDLIPFKFLHPYGVVSLLVEQNFDEKKSFKYGSYFGNRTIQYSHLLHYSNNIKIIYDERKKSDDIKHIQDELRSAERIFFLGFGYDKYNLDLLGIPDILFGKDNIEIYGTAYGLENNEIEIINDKLGNYKEMKRITETGKKYEINIESIDCLKLLKRYL